MNDKSGTLTRMKIIAYSDSKFSQEQDSLEVQINPSTLKYQQKVAYAVDWRMGTLVPSKRFNRIKASNISFDFIFDDTGVLPLTDGQQTKTIPELVEKLEKVVYRINNEIHRPNFLTLSWGCFIYKGQLSSLDYEYTLFRPDGSPLRVKVKLTIEGYLDPLTEAKKVGRNSPDLTRRIRLTDGETLAGWCRKIYGDATYCTDVARVNGLDGFRRIEPGTEIVFPPLKRNGMILKNE